MCIRDRSQRCGAKRSASGSSSELWAASAALDSTASSRLGAFGPRARSGAVQAAASLGKPGRVKL
eukprot:5974167-Alexandrium_andersonii.AAC.1